MDIYAWLLSNGIEYHRFDHPPVYTCEEAARLTPEMPGAKAKNLFLRDRRARRHFLLMLEAEQQVDLRELGRRLEAPGLGFASPERLHRYLKVEPGAVSLLALVNDRDREVELVMDQDLSLSQHFQCHPLVNTATLILDRQNILQFLDHTGHRLQAMEMPPRLRHDVQNAKTLS